jgi:hypothetical protein
MVASYANVPKIGPALGLAALGFAVLSTLASFAVLKASDGSPVSSWKYQPTVYLAVWTAISNKACKQPQASDEH